MQVLRNPSDLACVQNDATRDLLATRFQLLEEVMASTPDYAGFFMIAEPGDTIAELEATLTRPILSNRFDDLIYGDPGFTPEAEYIDAHGDFYELLFILSDDGTGVILIIPKHAHLPDQLLNFCADYAQPAHASVSS